MKKILLILILLIIITVLIKSNLFNDNMKPEDFKDTEPEIKIEKYFEGQVKAWGILQDRKGRVTRQFEANMIGKFENKHSYT